MVINHHPSSIIVRGSTTTLSIGAFSDLVSFSTRIEFPGLLVGRVTVISCCANLIPGYA